ncbi:hypothetical protein EOPP23_03990 [Endozoicomonas sp. OPT23]|uniref:hypothetical protein n=1 Tax=Endozoicomonas sp. OPT23 TaxID=2072845 RepID=UPI00129B7944|nr:hypothetical protein [Endozoicomonas sp. OPT23]MRI32156.1 hypothetical protein [Endozoicomonas sp. OPT23]
MSTPVDPQTPPTLTGSRGTVQLTDARRESLRAAGFSDAQIDALLSLANPDDQGNSLTPTHFSMVDKTTLNNLQFSGALSEAARQIVYVQTPVSMLNQVSDPQNWQGDTYIGPGAAAVNSYLEGESVDFSKPSLDALVMSVLSARAEIIEVQLRDQIQSIQDKNAQLEVANNWLARAKEAKANAGTSGNSSFEDRFPPGSVAPAGQSFKEYWDSLSAEYQSEDRDDSTSELDHNSADWDVNVEGLKAKIEALTSQSQLETTKLQQTINKYNQSFEMLSNFINKYYQSLSTVIQNLR